MPAFYPIKYSFISRIFFFIGLIFCIGANSYAQAPANDNCANAITIPIPAGGFGLGNFTSTPTNLTNATVQTGEAYAPAIFVAGLDKKSVWYKFSIPTIRAVRVTLSQPGTAITAGDAGFAVYQTGNCLPGNTDISSKLTPIVTFGNTYHPCVPSGDYLIQVSSKVAANGPITIQLEISDQTGAAYDHPNQAYAFDTVRYYGQKIDFNTECQSIEDSTELCDALYNKTDYNKTAWLTFTTPAYFDYIVVSLSGTGATSSYFPSNNNAPTYRTFGYTLYKGNAVNTAIKSLQVVDGCDSLASNGYYAGYKVYKCSDLQPKTTYSIQVFINKNFGDDIRMGIMVGGQVPTKAPKPILAAVPAPNAIGVLPSSPTGVQSYVTDVWGCNSRHTTPACGPSLPDSGILYNGGRYNLSSFFTFTLDNTAAIYFNAYVTQCGTQPLVRVFKQGLTANCADLDTANIIGTFNNNGTIDCLQPGKYTVQVSGQDYTQYYGYFTYGPPTSGSEQCLSNNLGTAFRLDMTAYTRKGANKYALNVKGAFDTINRVGSVMQPLADGVPYPSVSDTLGCQNTLRPADTTCSPVNNKVIYREFAVADSGIVDFSNLSYTYYSPFRYRLYSGDANALASAQNVFAYPDKVSGLKPKTECFDWNTNCTNKTACVIPGTYTFTTMGGDADVGRVDNPTFTFVKTRTLHRSPLTAQNLGSIMDTLGVNGGTIKSDVDAWSCNDNAVAINGVQPAIVGGLPATKAIYRQFYLKEAALVQIQNTGYYYCYGFAYGTKSLFYGRATDGFAGLSEVGGQWSSFPYSAGSTAGCNLLPAGWYTVVSYNQGPSYDSTFRSLNLEGRYNSSVSYRDEYNITITPTCPGPKYNRPYKASIDSASKQPHLVQWGNRVTNTTAYPRTDTTIILPTEHFNCLVDTPFSSHPIKACETSSNRVAYYVFKTTQVSFLQINAGGYYAAVYDKDVRKDSLQFATLKPIQICNNSAGYIQFCFFQPGTYTLVVFAKDANICQAVSPSIYIDKIGYSRFDYAKNAYDFGVVPPDSSYHYGKINDVNPVSGRAPSSDIFYCTTGASDTDPTDPVCNTTVNPNVYNSGANKPLYDSAFPPSNNVARRNLWYTFVVNQPGYVKVRVESKTEGHAYQQKFSVYQSNVDGSLPFSTVVSSGQVDSTVAQGLRLIGTNQQNWYYCANLNDFVSFYRDPCTSVTTRYYVLVENVNAEPYENGGTLPNTQTEMSIMVDSINLVLPKHDHYFQAGNIGTVGVGTFQGDTDNYSCATKDATDPFYYYGNYNNCQKTLWYKFNPTITGNVRFRMKVNGTYKYDYYNIQLFRQTIDGDSTIKGMAIQGYASYYDNVTNSYWAECCVSPGTYYLMLTGCEQINEFVYPEIQLVEAVGDFCARAVPAVLNGPGSVSASVLVNCHTIGTDYGEFGPKLTCPEGANTVDYKSSWFRMDIGGTDTLDVTAYLVENTNAASSDIKYRLMTGDCGAMQEQSCVLDALTQNTYQCLVPGQSYYVQVLTPVTKFNQAVTGTIDLKLSAVSHADTCAPLKNCLASANFNTAFDCNTDDSVKFVNFSTYGTSIAYKWTFGYNGQTSTAVSPSFFYPALPTDKSYTVKLVVTNTSCLQKDSVTKTITVPGRPYVNFGDDIAQCNSTSPILLTAASHSGATYLWQNGSTDDTFQVTATGSNDYWVKVSYNGCSSTDTIKVLISPITSRPLQHIILCADSVSVSASRGQGETYQWNTGATTASAYLSTPGYYWVDVTYFNCIYRDSFEVNNVTTARPLGNDTTVCLSGAGYVLDATTAGAVSYQWQDGSSGNTFKAAAAGEYNITINFGNCIVKDTVNITGFAAPVSIVTDTSICFGQALTLPWGLTVKTAGIYRDTLRFSGGCDSLVRRVTVTVKAKPDIGKDTTICLAQSGYPLDATTAGAQSYTWQDGKTGPTYTVTAAGLYWVAVNYGTCSSRDSVTINASAAPGISSTDTSICTGASLTLPWGAIVKNAGTYSDTLRSYRGCDSLIRIVNLTTTTKPALGRDTTLSICGGTSIDLTNIYNTTGFTSSWTLAGMAVANPSAVSTPGTYTLIVATAGGCTDTAIATLTISSKPDLGIDKSVAVCEQTFTDLNSFYNTSGLTSTWTIGGNAVANPSAVDIAGTYQLIANNVTCADTALLTLTVSRKPFIGNDSVVNICRGATANLSSIYSITGLTTGWTYNGNTINDPAAISAPGTYNIVASNATGCKDSASILVAFNPKPFIGNDTSVSICGSDRVDLTTIYRTTGLTFNWFVNDAMVPNPSAVGTGSYQLQVSNSYGCTDTAMVTISLNPKPDLGQDKVISVCAGSAADLPNLFITSGLTSNWTFGGVVVAAPSSVTLPGIYQLIVTNTAGCRDTAFVTVSINSKPAIGNDKTVNVCSGNSIDLTAQFVTNGLNTAWTLGGVAVANPSAVSIAGLYRLIVTNNKTCADTAMVNAVFDPKPNLGADKNISVCAAANNSIDLTKEFITTGLTASWTQAGNTVANPSAITAAGIYQLVVSNNATCADTVLVNIVVNPIPLLTITDPSPVCVPATANLTAAAITGGSTGGLDFTYWQNAAATISYLNPAAAENGVYYIKGTDANGCFSIKPVTVIVYSLPVAIAGNDTTICDQSFAILHGSAANLSGGAVSYLWSPPTGLSNADAPVTVANPGSSATYSLTVKVDYGPCTLSASDDIRVNMQPPVAAFAGNDTIAVLGVPHQLRASGGVNYLWIPAGPLNNASIADPLAVLQQDTRFVVMVTDFAGCVGTDTVFIKVYDGITYYVPNAFSPNGDGLNDVFRPIPVGIVSTELFRVFSRYGKLVFETNEWLKGWDGTYRGQKQPIGNYVWVIRGKGRNGATIEMRGNVVLVR